MYFTRPVFLLPVTPGWNGSPWAFPRASHHAVTGVARQGRGRVIRTRTRDCTYGFINRLSNRSVHSNSCGIVSHGRLPSPRHHCAESAAANGILQLRERILLRRPLRAKAVFTRAT